MNTCLQNCKPGDTIVSVHGTSYEVKTYYGADHGYGYGTRDHGVSVINTRTRSAGRVDDKLAATGWITKIIKSRKTI
jgi:hypothetical protein